MSQEELLLRHSRIGRKVLSRYVLEDEGDEIAGTEDECVSSGFEAGEVLPVDYDDAGEAEVDGGGEEGRGDS